MAAENIGNLIPTKIPGYSDSADIQAALRVYHYGSFSYDPANTSAAALVNPSIAYTINDLQDQITSISSGGINEDIFTAKGNLLSASASSTPLILASGSNNQFLVVNTATGTGLQWTNSLVGPLVTGLALSDSSIVFEGSVSDDFETTLTVVNPTADRTITLPNVTGTVITTGDTATVTNTMLAGSIANNKLSNSTISGVALGSNLNALTIGTGLSGTSYNGSSAVTVAIDSTVATLTGTQTLTNKTLTAPIINLALNAQTGTTFTPALTDNGKLVTLDNASAITLTVPTNISVSYATGAQINLLQSGEGQVTVVGDTGVTVYATPGANFRAQYSAATLIKLDTDTWLLTGDLSA